MDITTVAKSIMDAALDPQLWTKALDDTALFANAGGATLLPIRGRAPSVPASASLDDALHVYFRDGWHLKDERERGLPYMRRKGIFVDQDFATPEETQRSDYYRGFLAKFDINWSAGIGINVADTEWALMVQRGDRPGPFDEIEQERLLQLAGPMQQAALLSHTLAHGRAAGIAEAFDLVGHAGILIDRRGRVVRCNGRAENYMDTHFSIVRGELACHVGSDTRELRRLIHHICFDIGSAPGVQSTVISGKTSRPLLLQGLPLRHAACDYFGAARALLLIVDPFRDRAQVSTEDIRGVLGVSGAEAMLLSLLHADVSLPEAANRLGISYETARSQLKNAFQRTGTRRQSEILQLLNNIAGGLQP